VALVALAVGEWGHCDVTECTGVAKGLCTLVCSQACAVAVATARGLLLCKEVKQVSVAVCMTVTL
jgi:hypothetical protein